MPATVANLTDAVIQLPAHDRAYIAERILASLDEAELESQWMSAAKRRADEVRSGAVTSVPAEQVYQRIEELLA